MTSYAMTITLPGTLIDVRDRVQQALKEQGFGILTEIDVQRTLQEKIGKTMEPYLILGACNPQLASKALDAERAIGLLLPCNVVLRQTDGGTEVSILDPEAMFSVVDVEMQQELAELPGEAKKRLQAALTALMAG
jgi:uncharacterized protein (DUF302 family)